MTHSRSVLPALNEGVREGARAIVSPVRGFPAFTHQAVPGGECPEARDGDKLSAGDGMEDDADRGSGIGLRERRACGDMRYEF